MFGATGRAGCKVVQGSNASKASRVRREPKATRVVKESKERKAYQVNKAPKVNRAPLALMALLTTLWRSSKRFLPPDEKSCPTNR
jgi:hypothetical protein